MMTRKQLGEGECKDKFRQRAEQWQRSREGQSLAYSRNKMDPRGRAWRKKQDEQD